MLFCKVGLSSRWDRKERQVFPHSRLVAPKGPVVLQCERRSLRPRPGGEGLTPPNPDLSLDPQILFLAPVSAVFRWHQVLYHLQEPGCTSIK